MLFEPDRSAEPPIILLFVSVKIVNTFSEDFLVAVVSGFLIIFCFSVSKFFLNSLEKVFSIRFFFLL